MTAQRTKPTIDPLWLVSQYTGTQSITDQAVCVGRC